MINAIFLLPTFLLGCVFGAILSYGEGYVRGRLIKENLERFKDSRNLK